MVVRRIKRIFLICIILQFTLGTILVQAKDSNQSFSNKGIIFFAPIDKDMHNEILPMTTVNGAEIFMTWKTTEPEEGNFDWSMIDKYIEMYKKEGKELSLRIAIGNGLPNDTPKWLYNDYGVRRMITGYWTNFENGLKDYELGDVSNITNDKDDVLSGENSLVAKNSTNDSVVILKTGDKQNIISDNYSIQFDYKVIAETSFYAKYITQNGTEVVLKEWTENEGEEGSKLIDFIPSEKNGKVVLGIEGPGKMIIDNVNIADVTDNGWFGSNMGLPNFFDPIFKEKYEAFVEEFANKYDDEETITSVAIGGFGRWEEVTLDPNVYDGFEDQLITFGYTDERYLEQLRWAIDLYEKYFKKTKLTMCTYGHGDFRYTDEELVNWTIAGYAAQKGITIKYNGWQEICSDWGANNHFTYQFNRYRYDDNVETAYEEGGQITNNYLNIMGHPLSTINRALIDNTDYLWVYGIDVKDPHINRYFHYVNEQAGNVLNTRFYNRLGEYEIRSGYDFNKYTYYNIWNGIFLSNDWNRVIPTNYEDRILDYTDIEGEKCVGTTDEAHVLYFSVDDRQKYNGMYGSTISFEYYDNGNDTMTLNCYYQDDDEWQQIGTVKKTDSKEWKRATFYVPNAWANTYIGQGSSNLEDFSINDNNDGVEYLKTVEMLFVPARDWKMEKVISSDVSDEYENVIIEMSQEINLNGKISSDDGICGFEIPIAAKNAGMNNAMVSIYQKIEDQWKLVGKKEHYMPADKDKVYVPVIPDNASYTYKIELKNLQGDIGWYKDSDNNLSYNIYKYLPTECEVIDDSGYKMKEPFYGFAVEGKPSDDIKIRLYKNSKNRDMIIDSSVKLDKEGKGYVYFEPQVPGSYEIEGDISEVEIKALSLERRYETYEPKRNSVGETLKSWDLGKTNSSWKTNYDKKDISLAEGNMRIELNEKDFTLINDNLDLQGNIVDNIEFRIKNNTTASLARVYWKNEGEKEFNASKSAFIPIVSNDDRMREYSFQIGLEEGWENHITGLKIEPVCGNIEVGSIELRNIAITRGKKPNHKYNQVLDLTKVDGTSSSEVMSENGISEKREDNNERTNSGKGMFNRSNTYLIGSIVILIIFFGWLLTRRLKRRNK